MKAPDSLRRRLGFTMIEVMTALMVMSVVVRVGIPGYQGVVRRAEAVQVAADFNLVRQSVAEYQADFNSWPPDYALGVVPPELAPYLDGLVFNRGRYRLDWQNWALPDGLPGRPGARSVLALSVETEDRALGEALVQLLGSNASHFLLGNTYTFVLEVD